MPSAVLYLALTEWPSITRKCSAWCVGLGNTFQVLSTLGNSSNTCCKEVPPPRGSTVGSAGKECSSTVGSEGVAGTAPMCRFFFTTRHCGHLSATTPMVANKPLPDGSTSRLLQPPPRASSCISPESTSSPKFLRKCAPRKGSATSARRNVHVNLLPPAATCTLQPPQQAIGEWSAVHKRGPDVGC